ncbi:hypothetical protein BG015_000817 [Linnemannia schmuckeri]|uniref:Uncharacterized protein n=1 Tax=Linnemannia schmuckeri TaxID=64567 RepID=A0A9P5V6V7_9FUNG|nr:hypothetical protein BG015_000817 [Linnemannia schmuckeri]
MRSSTITAAAAMAILSVVSSQTTTDPATVAACNACITSAGIAAVPACKGLENAKGVNPAAPTDKQRACWCGLATNKTWTNECVRADKCPAEAIKGFSEVYGNLVSKPGTCDNLSASTSATDGARFCRSSSAKVIAAAGAAVAIAGALLLDPDDVHYPADIAVCATCVDKAAITAFPACKSLENTEVYPTAGPADQQKTY